MFLKSISTYSNISHKRIYVVLERENLIELNTKFCRYVNKYACNHKVVRYS